jgi:hypothetical protein
MPKGVPSAGFRVRKGRDTSMFYGENKSPIQTVENNESDEQIADRLNDVFDILKLMTEATSNGSAKAVIVSGAPGLGKSFTVEEVLKPLGDTVGFVKGFVRPTGLYKALHEYQHPGNVLVFDDCDSAFGDETSLNLLKAACDTLDTRKISYGAETNMEDADGNKLPRSFEFNGAIIFITNLDFEQMIASGSKLSPHLEALMSRSHYINLGMKTKRDYLVRIKQVISLGMLRKRNISEEGEKEIMDWVFENVEKFRELSLRMVIKASDLYKSNNSEWKRIASATLFRAGR